MPTNARLVQNPQSGLRRSSAGEHGSMRTMTRWAFLGWLGTLATAAVAPVTVLCVAPDGCTEIETPLVGRCSFALDPPSPLSVCKVDPVPPHSEMTLSDHGRCADIPMLLVSRRLRLCSRGVFPSDPSVYQDIARYEPDASRHAARLLQSRHASDPPLLSLPSTVLLI